MTTRIPDAVAANCRKSPERMAWLEGLPAAVEELEQRWELRPDAPLRGEEPSCSYVEAVRRQDGTPAVLKISMPHMEQEHETDGLRFWNGDPTVRLLESDDELRAMLLERCQPGTTLRVLIWSDLSSAKTHDVGFGFSFFPPFLLRQQGVAERTAAVKGARFGAAKRNP